MAMKCEYCEAAEPDIHRLIDHVREVHPEHASLTAFAGLEKRAQRVFHSEAYIVAIDDWFLAREDWTEHPAFATKFGKVRMAAARAEEERVQHPSANIRVVKILQRFTLVE